VVPERDPEALADSMARLLTDTELAARLASEALLHVERGFNLQRSVTELRSLFPEAA
jgi:glycosyltransferase involved in cell wall biosynthesis